MAKKKARKAQTEDKTCPIPEHCWEEIFKGNEHSDPARRCRHCGQSQRLHWVDTEEELWKATWTLETEGSP